MKALHPKTPFLSFTGLAVFIVLACAVLTGCGEVTDGTDAQFSQGKDVLPENLAAETKTREHWETRSDMLFDGLSVTYTPTDPGGEPLTKTGDNESIGVSLSLVDNAGSITADSTVSLSAGISLTGYPMTLNLQGAQASIEEDSFEIIGSRTMTLKNASGELIRTPVDLTLTITPSSASKYLCHAVLQVAGLGTRCQFSVEIHRTGENDPISFVQGTWAKKSPGIVISYPRKLYTDQTEIRAVPTRDLLMFSINADLINPMASGVIEFPAEMSPNHAPIRLSFTDTPIQLSDEKKIVLFQISGTLDLLDLESLPVSSNYSLSLSITKKIITETDNTVEGLPDLRHAARYTCTATLVLDAINTRSTLAETIDRTDTSDSQALFAGADFVLAAGNTHAVTHAVTSGDTADLVQAPYGLIGFNLNINPDDSGTAFAQGTILLPFEATPATAPFMAISFDGAQPEITGDASIRIVTGAQLDKTDAMGFLTSIDAALTLDVSRSDDGTVLCYMDIESADRMTRIHFEDLELMRLDGGTELSSSQWAVLDAPYHILGCTSAPATQKIADGDLGLDLTLHKRLADNRSFIIANGGLNISEPIACTGQPLSFSFANAMVELAQDGRGFTLNTPAGEGDETAEMTLSLGETAPNQFEFQVDVILPNSTVLHVTVPATRTQGTGSFLTHDTRD